MKDDSAGDGGNGGGSNGGNGSGSNGGSGNGSSGGVSNGSGNSSNGGSGSAPNISGTQANSPVTGDNLPIMLYVLLAAAAFGVMTVIYVRKKKN